MRGIAWRLYLGTGALATGSGPDAGPAVAPMAGGGVGSWMQRGSFNILGILAIVAGRYGWIPGLGSTGHGQAGPAAPASCRALDLAVQDLVGDGVEGGADGAGGNAVEGGAGGVDLGLGGAAGLGEGG